MKSPFEEMKEYKIIKSFYHKKCAKRSNVPLMNHIDEGLDILNGISADNHTLAAYCLHPLLQGDNEFFENLFWLSKQVDPYTLALTLEYRSKANSYLCKDYTNGWTQLEITNHVGHLIKPVKQMLIADKLQNKKDFEIYHKETHPNTVNLTKYFNNWLEYLEVLQ